MSSLLSGQTRAPEMNFQPTEFFANNSTPLLLSCSCTQLYKGPYDSTTCGLFKYLTGRPAENLLSVEVKDPENGEETETPRSARLVVLSKDLSGRYLLLQRLPLPELTDSLLVSLPQTGMCSAVCLIFLVYELECQQQATTSNTEIANTWSIVKEHQFPDSDCTYQSNLRLSNGQRMTPRCIL